LYRAPHRLQRPSTHNAGKLTGRQEGRPNLNQVAHHLNATRHLRSIDELDQCITDLKVAIARVISL
jgi:hypothetical protein